MDKFIYVNKQGTEIVVNAKNEKESREVLSFLVDDLTDWELKA